MNSKSRDHLAKLTDDTDRLLMSSVWRISDLLREHPEVSRAGGVYIISCPTEDERIVYIGRTKSNTIHGRISDHCRISTKSDLRGMLPQWPDFPSVATDYGVRWLAVENPEYRAQLELFAIAVLAPTFNRP